jgi:isoleucyl-tRNA synthetase
MYKTNSYFPDFGTDYRFPAMEEAVLRYWQEQRIFDRLLSTREKRQWFGFYDGPSFTTGRPHFKIKGSDPYIDRHLDARYANVY